MSYDAPPIERQPGQERYIHIAVTNNDEKNHAYVRNALTPDWQRMDVDMAVNGGWYRYAYQNTQENSGRVRLVRQEGLLSGYVWQDGDWLLLSNWRDGFTDPVYLDFRFRWITPEPSSQMVRFTIERLETEEGLLFDTVEVEPLAVEEDALKQPPAPETESAKKTPAGTRPPVSKPSAP